MTELTTNCCWHSRFKNLTLLFIIAQPYNDVIREKEVVVVQLPFNELDKYIFSVLVHREGHRDTEAKKFKINVKSWDDITLTSI